MRPTLNELPCGERAVRCLLGQPVDRVPFGVSIGWLPWQETTRRWQEESGNPDLSVPEYFGYDGGFKMPAMHAGIFPAFEHTILEEDDDFVVYREERGITMRQRHDRSSIPEFLDYPVKSESDWRRLKAERLRIDEPGRVYEDWPQFRECLEATGEAVRVGSYPFGVFGTVRDLLGVEEMLMAFYDAPGMVRDMMEHLTSLWLSIWEQVATEVPLDHIHLWEDMAGRQGTLVSPGMIEEFMMPCYDRIAEFAGSHGVRLVSVDSDGDCSELVNIVVRHGVNVFLPFEVQAGNDIREYRRQYPELGIIGGLDKRALAEGRHAVDKVVDRAAEMVRKGRYVPEFDHLIPPDVPWENFRYAAEKLKDVCYSR